MPELIVVTVDPAHIQVQPAGKAEANIVLKNRSEEVENYILSLEGVPPEWADINPNQLSAFPYTEVRSHISVHPPDNTQGAIYRLTVCAKSQEREGVQGRGVLEVDVPAPQPQIFTPVVDTQTDKVKPPDSSPFQIASQIELRAEPNPVNPPPPPAVQWNLRLRNAGKVLDTFGFSFSRIIQNWVTIDPVELQLYPGEEGTASLVVQPASDTKAGSYPFTLTAYSHVNINERTDITLNLDIKASLGFQLDVTPREAESQGGRDFQVWMSSIATANSDLQLDLSANDQDNACEYTFQPQAVLLPARQRVMSTLHVRPRSVLGPNERKQYKINVTAVPRQAAAPTQTIDVRLTQIGSAPVSLEIRPQVQPAEMESDYVVYVANPSGLDVRLLFSADDPEMACDYVFLPDQRYISANGTSSTRLHVKARALYRGAGQKQIVFTVKATRQGELLPTSTVQGSLNQMPGKPIALELIPPQQSQPSRAKYSVRVHNPFNAQIQVWLEARDEADALAFTLSPQRFRIPPGGDGLIEMRVIPKDKLLPTDQRRVHKFVVSALVEGTSTPTTVSGTLAQVKGFDWSGPVGKVLGFIVAALKLMLKIFLWVIPWIIVLIILIFIADLAIAGVYFIVQTDTQLGPVITGLVPDKLLVFLHDTLLFKSISDSIVEAVAKIMAVLQVRFNPPPTPAP